MYRIGLEIMRGEGLSVCVAKLRRPVLSAASDIQWGTRTTVLSLKHRINFSKQNHSISSYSMIMDSQSSVLVGYVIWKGAFMHLWCSDSVLEGYLEGPGSACKHGQFGIDLQGA
jgi:hypothetical protein